MNDSIVIFGLLAFMIALIYFLRKSYPVKSINRRIIKTSDSKSASIASSKIQEFCVGFFVPLIITILLVVLGSYMFAFLVLIVAILFIGVTSKHKTYMSIGAMTYLVGILMIPGACFVSFGVASVVPNSGGEFAGLAVAFNVTILLLIFVCIPLLSIYSRKLIKGMDTKKTRK